MKAGKPYSATAKKHRSAMPRRDTVKMVEDAFRKENYFESIAELRKSLPREVEDETLKAIVAHIRNLNRIEQNIDGSLVWTWMESEAARKSLEESTEL